MKKKEPTLEDMKKEIARAGGLLYQYRPCRRDLTTIYDIENIRHGVVYAQTPLNMNDPFDSMIGFCPEKLYENIIQLFMEEITIEDPNIKIVIGEMLKYKIMGEMANLLSILNSLRKYLRARQVAMHETSIDGSFFVIKNLSTLYSKCPKDIKNRLSKDMFVAFSLVVLQLDKLNITEKDITDMYQLDDLLNKLHQTICEVRDTLYVPTIQTFLSKLTITCFSSSGWDNQLMWAHYANSYSGICVEYDFAKMDEFIGFVYPVNYQDTRPTLELQDIGITRFVLDSENHIEQCEPDMRAIFDYLLAKNTCWNYEKEWRIINVGEANTPLFINLPYIKSITFGINIDSVCKHLLWDVCKQNGIECYSLCMNTENYVLERKKLTDDDFIFDVEDETEYSINLFHQIEKNLKEISLKGSSEDEEVDFSKLRPMLSDTVDVISNLYYLKASLNRICENVKEEEHVEIPNSLIENIVQLDMFVQQVEKTIPSIHESIPNLLLGGKISRKDYDIIQKQLGDVNELIDKYEEQKWNLLLTVGDKEVVD